MPEWVLSAETDRQRDAAMEWAAENGYSTLDVLLARAQRRHAQLGCAS